MSLRAKLKALEERVALIDAQTTHVCRMKNGDRAVFMGFSVMEPFLAGKIAYIGTDNPESAAMLRALDIERDTIIEIIELDGDKLHRTPV